MLKNDNIYLHDLIRTMIDIEMSVMNGKYEQAYHSLSSIKTANLGEFFSNMRAKVRDKIFELHGDKL